MSGDSAAHFETEDGTLCLLLSDGMGCGEAAQRESSMAVRLLERFLRAGIDAPPALKTLNSALSLRAESTDSFTTVDLLTLSLQTLEGELYKYGAAPSYLKRGGTVRRVTCSCLPAGLQEGSPPPEATHIKLSPGCFFVMLSDGVADSLDDEWLQNLLAGWEGHDPQQLVAAILADSMEKRGGTDDAGVLALYIPEDSARRRSERSKNFRSSRIAPAAAGILEAECFSIGRCCFQYGQGNIAESDRGRLAGYGAF